MLIIQNVYKTPLSNMVELVSCLGLYLERAHKFFSIDTLTHDVSSKINSIVLKNCQFTEKCVQPNWQELGRCLAAWRKHTANIRKNFIRGNKWKTDLVNDQTVTLLSIHFTVYATKPERAPQKKKATVWWRCWAVDLMQWVLMLILGKLKFWPIM